MLKYENRILAKMETGMEGLGITRCKNTEFKWGERTYVMGIINVSPDSFSGDGLTVPDLALAQAKRMIEEGADILDVGGESTRPGYTQISEEEEIRRVLPVIEKLASQFSVPISVDSYKYGVVRRALDAGAAIINDQWGLKFSPDLAALAAERNAPLILMNNLRDKETLGPDILAEILASLRAALKKARQAGVPVENLIVDPGIGFIKSWQADLTVINRLDELKALGRPVLLGPSRKSFIKMTLNLPVDERVEGTAAAVAIGIARGADIVRVHDVKPIARICKISDAIIRNPK
jgi:dihydropteroate synthase